MLYTCPDSLTPCAGKPSLWSLTLAPHPQSFTTGSHVYSQLHFPAGLRGRCSQPHFTVEIPEAQKAEVTFARLQRKLVAELALKPRHPMSCLRLSLLSLYRLPAACHHRPPPICMLCHRDGREVKPTAFSRKGGTCDSFLATVRRRH